jgi:ADP-ribose pyrophosphatase
VSEGDATGRRLAYRGDFIEVRRARIRLPDGRVVERDEIHHPDVVAILPVVDADHILMIRQFRYVLNREIWEVPAGKMDPGEDPPGAAARELEEETGHRAGHLERILGFYPSPGILTEYMHVFVASELVPTATHMDPDEQIVTHVKSRAEIRDWLAAGEIQDAKSLIALNWWLSRPGPGAGARS